MMMLSPIENTINILWHIDKCIEKNQARNYNDQDYCDWIVAVQRYCLYYGVAVDIA